MSLKLLAAHPQVHRVPESVYVFIITYSRWNDAIKVAKLPKIDEVIQGRKATEPSITGRQAESEDKVLDSEGGC
jgi:hypothetical protein